MSDQRILSIAALVLLVAAVLLPWPIAALGHDEPALASAVAASFSSLLLAWLGRTDSLGRKVLGLTGGAAAISVLGALAILRHHAGDPVVTARRQAALVREEARPARETLWQPTEEIVKATEPTASAPRSTTPQPRIHAGTVTRADLEAAARRRRAQEWLRLRAQDAAAAAAQPDVASGPDPMPMVGWPERRATAVDPIEIIAVPPGEESTTSPDEPTSLPFVGTWVDTAEQDPGQPLEIVADESGLWLDRGTKIRLERFFDVADAEEAEPGDARTRPDAPRMKHAVAVIDDGDSERHLRVEPVDATLVVDTVTVFKDGSGRPDHRAKAVYAHRDDVLPNGYRIFFAGDFEAGLVKEGVNYGAIVAGPHVVELGNSGTVIFGRIDPKKGLPPHPDHAPGFFVIDSAADRTTTGLDRGAWLAALEALGVESPRLSPPKRKWPKRF